MQKAILIVAIAVLSIGSAMAQSPVKKTIKIPVEQVPMAVRTAYEKDFGSIPQDGYWMAYITTTLEGSRTVATPIWYSYNKRSKEVKAEVRFSPAGELISSKGVSPAGKQGEEEPVKVEEKIG